MKIAKKYLIFLLLGIATALGTAAHPYYISLCQVNFNQETESLEIQLKIFADDLALGLEKQGHSELYLGEEREDPKTNDFIFDYLQKVMQFTVNGQAMKYNFIGRELEDGAVWSYLEIPGVSDLETIAVTSTLLTEVIDTQANLVQVQKGKEIKNLLLGKRKTKGSLSFEKR